MVASSAADPEPITSWSATAAAGLAAATTASPDAFVPAYPTWQVRDLAVHVIRIYGLAAASLRTGGYDRPRTELVVQRDDDPDVLASAVLAALHEAHDALLACRARTVWTPNGSLAPRFWLRRLLRESVLHRWDGEQAGGRPSVPAAKAATELIDEFLDTDVRRAFARGRLHSTGRVGLHSGDRRWIVDLSEGTTRAAGSTDDAANVISGDAASLWLWLVQRDGLPGPVSVRDADGAARRFTDVIAGLGRPSR